MSCLLVVAPGLQTTVQDLGRPGYAHLGVSASGAADPLALRLGNLLVGNEEHRAALEMTISGGTFCFPEGATFALAGSAFEAEMRRERVRPWVTESARPGDRLRMGPAQSGARCYLCVRGGVRVPLFLGSASTHLVSGLGGVAGRAVRAGDLLRIGREPLMAAKACLREWTPPGKVFRVTPGAHIGRFGDAALAVFYSSEYIVTEQANRMGLRLRGPELRTSDGAGVLSQGVSCGSIQVTNAGQPLILFVEQQTTGGYPLIASVIAVDLPALGQLRPGDAIRFQAVTVLEAVDLLKRRERWIASRDMLQ